MPSLDRQILEQTLRGYAEVNRITEAERRARLQKRTIQESLEIYSTLYRTWASTGKRMQGDQERLDRERLAEHLRLRKMFVILAQNQGLSDE